MKVDTTTEHINLPLPEILQSSVLSTRLGLTHLPLSNPRAYYRSKVFSVTSGINPLITAAACLLTTLASLREIPYVSNVQELYQELAHEIRAFETQAQTQGYRSELILVARYILCATFDEIILNTAWGKQSEWPKHKLLTVFHNEDWGGERFFLILERLSADVALHIDVLELIYLCLSLGFIGKFALMENGLEQLNKTTENLYQAIRWQRGELKKELLIQETTPKSPEITQQEPLPLWLLAIFVFIVLSTLYFAFNFMLGNNTIQLFQQFTTL